MSFWWVIWLMIGGVLLGYICGRRLGKEEGQKLGLSLAPIVLRQKSMEKGYCLLCDNGREGIIPPSSSNML